MMLGISFLQETTLVCKYLNVRKINFGVIYHVWGNVIYFFVKFYKIFVVYRLHFVYYIIEGVVIWIHFLIIYPINNFDS